MKAASALATLLALTLALLTSGDAWLWDDCVTDAQCAAIDARWPWDAQGARRP